MSHALDLLIDLHLRNDRQGPGSDHETRRAIELAGLDRSRTLRIADLGCGTGASALVLASELDAHVTAVDAAGPFIARLRERAALAGVADRVEGFEHDMAQPPLADGSVDVIWSEGAIYNIGFDRGLRAWSRCLKPGGVLACTELTWTTPARPQEIDAYWSREYPGIRTLSENIRGLEVAGFAPLATFVLPRSCWTEGYYAPVRAGLEPFLTRHGGSRAAQSIVDAELQEMATHERFGQWYAYVFYIARLPE